MSIGNYTKKNKNKKTQTLYLSIIIYGYISKCAIYVYIASSSSSNSSSTVVISSSSRLQCNTVYTQPPPPPPPPPPPFSSLSPLLFSLFLFQLNSKNFRRYYILTTPISNSSSKNNNNKKVRSRCKYPSPARYCAVRCGTMWCVGVRWCWQREIHEGWVNPP